MRRIDRAILAEVRRGATNRQIGRRLGLSPLTVKSYLSSIYADLGVHTRTAAVYAAIERGFLPVGHRSTAILILG